MTRQYTHATIEVGADELEVTYDGGSIVEVEGRAWPCGYGEFSAEQLAPILMGRAEILRHARAARPPSPRTSRHRPA